MSTWAVVLAAGSGSRLAAAGLGEKKQFLAWRGLPLYWHGAKALARVARVAGLVFVFPADEFGAAHAAAQDILADAPLNVPCLFAEGGARRQDSVYNALTALPGDCSRVLVHDAARPFASAALSNALLDALDAGARAAIPGVAVKDTIKHVHMADGVEVVDETPRRAELRAVQTPQAFDLPTLVKAHEFCRAGGVDVTDDASMVEAMGLDVAVVPGEETNIKITTPEDLAMLTTDDAPRIPVTGWGYDVHKYGAGRPMVLAGVPIQGAPEIIAHSDGDVLLHALADAILGCLGRGDIGEHFPDTDERFKGIESSILVNEVLTMAHEDGLEMTHVDLTLICQTPRLTHFKPQIRTATANLLRLDERRVNLKATTEEKLGFTGRGEGIKAVACVTGTVVG